MLEAVLSKLPERWREAFLLRIANGWDVDEVARAEGIEAGDVRSIVDVSRAFLGDWLEDHGLAA